MRQSRWKTPQQLGVIFAVITLHSVTGSAGQEVPSERIIADEVGNTERVVQEQLEAYNRRDLEAFLATYSSEIKLYNFPDELTTSGLEALRERYGSFFERTPDLHAEVTKRIVQGDYVIDHEQVTIGGRNLSAVAIYQVQDGKIINVWFVR